MKRNHAILMVAAMLVVPAQAGLCAGAGVGDKLSISITNQHGEVFTNLTVARILNDGLVLEHPAGQSKVKYQDLPPAVREKYQPLAAAAAKKEQKKGEADAAYLARQQQLQAEQSQQRTVQENSQQPEPVQHLVIDIPSQGWRITVMNAGFEALKRHFGQDRFVVSTAPGTNGFNLAIYVERPGGSGTGNDDVFNFYWPRTSQNPALNQSSVKIEKKKKFVKVSFIMGDVPNVNYYFAYKGSWVEMNVSKSPFERGDEKLFADFEENFSYGE
jgi:hypothetical protein